MPSIASETDAVSLSARDPFGKWSDQQKTGWVLFVLVCSRKTFLMKHTHKKARVFLALGIKKCVRTALSRRQLLSARSTRFDPVFIEVTRKKSLYFRSSPINSYNDSRSKMIAIVARLRWKQHLNVII